ncbi:HTH domain-containing protein [Engelhardtia mirabilis]|uniref:Uncharacterized protein n=1 Tax=Engelhardtia mirabilis TaxID=2528011 RepID=A0A518BK10_9BACT|nr:hypothetical protein Pla133_23920 [Planctomycetes bacterium Pla133]QDV01638.1 hypothetical protein Pla86_23910 [Planctomycetes bacterium Pla86]
MTELSWHEAIVKVLEGATEPLHYNQIAQEVAQQGLRENLGATPASTVAAQLSISLKNDGDQSPFERVSRGVYRLRGQVPKVPSEAVSPSEDEDEPETGLINAFGMYWLRERVLWEKPRLLGQQQPGSSSVDFMGQRGVYLLHDRREVVYVGRTTDQAMGQRLRQHTTDRLGGRWDRFSWFGILPVTSDGTLADSPSETFNIENLIATMEALLIEGLEPPQNRKRGDGFSAVEFIQVVDPEIEERQRKAMMVELLSKK